MKKELVIVIIALVILSSIGLFLYFSRKDKFLLADGRNVNYRRAGTAPACNPLPYECDSGYKYVGNCRFPSTKIVKDMCESASKNCVSGYYSTCSNNLYPDVFIKQWMTKSATFIANKPFNHILIPGSHDTMTYAIPKPHMSTSIPYQPDGTPGPFYGADGREGFKDITDWENVIKAAIAIAVPIIGIPIAFTPNLVYGVIALWGRAQDNTLTEQLNNGIRYLDMRVTINTNNGTKTGLNGQPAPTFADLTFTHTLITINITFEQAIREIDAWAKQNPTEVLIIDFHYIMNMCTTDKGMRFYVSPEAQYSIQKQALTLMDTLWGKRIAPPDCTPQDTYGAIVSNGIQFFLLFDTEASGAEHSGPGDKNTIVPLNNPGNLNFVDYWKVNGFPWVKARNKCISDTFANNYDWSGDPSGSIAEARETLGPDGNYYPAKDAHGKTLQPDDRYCTYTPEDKFVVYGATVGLTSSGTDPVKQIAYGFANPSAIGSPNGLGDMSANYSPVLIYNVLANYAPELFFKGNSTAELQLPVPGPAGLNKNNLARNIHNIFLYDNCCKYNVSSLIIAANRGELGLYMPMSTQTTSDDQCWIRPISGGCGADTGFDPNSCTKGRTGKCYTKTGVLCSSDNQCHYGWADGECIGTSGIQNLNCEMGFFNCSCSNPHNWDIPWPYNPSFSCEAAKKAFGIQPGVSFGSAPREIVKQWTANKCS